SSADPDTVHDVRVALRRCRSVAATMEEVDPDPAWEQMRKAGRKLFRSLGDLRDTQVMQAWVKKLGAEGDPLRTALLANLDPKEKDYAAAAVKAAGKFDTHVWRRFERHLSSRSRLVPCDGLAAECLALERFEDAKELHRRALRTERS